jgi:hypothetical protein
LVYFAGVTMISTSTSGRTMSAHAAARRRQNRCLSQRRSRYSGWRSDFSLAKGLIQDDEAR